MAQCTYIDGIGSSQAIDTAGEIVDLKGLDCSSLLGAAMNWEHKSDIPAQIVGKIVDYKKIFSEKDCDTERQKHYWNKIKIPFLYCLGRLFDDKKESSRECAALFKDDAENPSEPNMVGFSIEGAKVHKEGMTITRSIARKLTITNLPANKTCVAAMLPSHEKAPEDDIDSIFKTEPMEVEFFKPNSKYLEFLEKKEKDMKKDDLLAGGSLAVSEMNKSAPSWGAGKKTSDAVHFSHPEHGTVSIHKQPTGEFHVKHNGAMAGIGGVKGSFSSAGEAGKHAKNYMSGVSNKKVFAPSAHNRPSPSMLGKSLEAGSGMVAPSQLTGGAALAKEARIGSLSTGKEDKPAKEMTSVRIGMGRGSSVTMSGTGMMGMGKKQKSDLLARAEEAYDKWEKKENFREFMKKSMPHLTKGEVDAIGQTIALKKSMKAEGKLSKMLGSYYGKQEHEVPASQNECNEVIKKK